MEVINAGYQYRHPMEFNIARPNGSGDCLLLLIRTDAYVVLNGVRQPVQANAIILYRKGTPQYYGAAGATYVNDWVHFDMDERDAEKLARWQIPFDTVVYLHDLTDLSGFVKSICIELYSEGLYKREASGLYMELLLLEIAKQLHAQVPSKQDAYEKKLTDLRNEIYCEPEHNWTVDELCGKVNLSRSYLQHLYKARFGVSIVADLTRSRIERAKYMLSGTDSSVSEIALQCGYNSDVHFMRVFRKTVGMTPSQYRRMAAVSSHEMETLRNQPPFSL